MKHIGNKSLYVWVLWLLGFTAFLLLGFFIYILARPHSADQQLQPTGGYKAIWVTKPTIFQRIARSYYELGDKTYCKFSLLGWEGNSKLFFTEQCGSTSQVTKMYDMNVNRTFITAQPKQLTQVIKDVSNTNVFPITGRLVFNIVISSYTYSPDKNQIAVVDYYFFGTDDIYILYK